MSNFDYVNASLEAIWRRIGRLENRAELLETGEADVLGCRVINTSTTQNIASVSITALTFTTDLINTDSNWSTANPTRLICSSPGYYQAGGGYTFTASEVTTGTAGVFVRLSGGTILSGERFALSAGETAICETGTGMFDMTTADYVEICAYHSMSTTKNVSAASTGNQHNCHGWLTKID